VLYDPFDLFVPGPEITNDIEDPITPWSKRTAYFLFKLTFFKDSIGDSNLGPGILNNSILYPSSVAT
jgi:hypothetical protein